MIPTENHRHIIPSYAVVPSTPPNNFKPQTDLKLIDDPYMFVSEFLEIAFLLINKQTKALERLSMALTRSDNGEKNFIKVEKGHREIPAKLPEATRWQQAGSSTPANYVLAVAGIPTTSQAIERMVERAINLNDKEKVSLLKLCQKYQQIFNVADKPLSITNLTILKMEPPQVSKL